MRANDVRSMEVTRHGAYVCLRASGDVRRVLARLKVPALAERLKLKNEFETAGGHPTEAVGYARRTGATPRDIVDDGLLGADAVVHVASPAEQMVTDFCAELARMLGPDFNPRILRGVVRPPSFTGNAMHNFAYANQIVQRSGEVMPNAFLVPLSKVASWWAKNWMERHTYFLPRYGETGEMLSEGHALAAAHGIECILRRTYRYPVEAAPAGEYDFVNYFECSDADLPAFHGVCAALRDVARNPEWNFVNEGPTWHGRRVETWAELFA